MPQSVPVDVANFRRVVLIVCLNGSTNYCVTAMFAQSADSRKGTMKDDEFRALARRHALDALKMLAAVAVDQTASPSDREHARRTLEMRLEQGGDDVPSDLRHNLEKTLRRDS
jgi:hypothetical protein